MNWHFNDVSKVPEMEKIVVNALPQNVDFAREVDDGLVLQWTCYTAAAPQWWWHRFGQKQIIQILATPTCCVLAALWHFTPTPLFRACVWPFVGLLVISEQEGSSEYNVPLK